MSQCPLGSVHAAMGYKRRNRDTGRAKGKPEEYSHHRDQRGAFGHGLTWAPLASYSGIHSDDSGSFCGLGRRLPGSIACPVVLGSAGEACGLVGLISGWLAEDCCLGCTARMQRH